jgi:hypothetical protein
MLVQHASGVWLLPLLPSLSDGRQGPLFMLVVGCTISKLVQQHRTYLRRGLSCPRLCRRWYTVQFDWCEIRKCGSCFLALISPPHTDLTIQRSVQLKALQELAAAEAAAAAARSEFDQVARRNEQDMDGFAERQAADIQALLLRWVEAVAVAAEKEAGAWLRAAEDLGADESHVAAINALGQGGAEGR